MNQPPAGEPKSRRTVLELITDRTGLAPKVLLPDSDSEHGPSPLVAPAAASSVKLVPQGRGNYQILGEIARGGMGVILKGHDTDLGRDVALKVLEADLAKRPEVVQRFIEEAQIGGQLQHPGIVPVYELGLMADERPYFTMKLIKGHTLASLFNQRKAPEENRGRLLTIFESVCQTVAYAHSKSVLHRDLKPANVMVGAFGEVQVVDWGLAKVLRRGGVADEKRAKEQTSVHTIIETVRSGPGSSGSDSMVGSVMGTPAYMAPEQAQGEVEKLDERADVFSLGAILCELLTGRPPYEEKENESIVSQAAHASLDSARERLQACDADPLLVRLCSDCLMPARAARPANAAIVAKFVHEYLATVEERAHKAELSATEARIKASEERRAKRLTLALAGTIVAAVAIGGGALWWASRERAQRAEELARRMAQTRTAVETAYGESIELAQKGEPEEALASARRALSLAETGDADEALLDHARKFVAKAELDVGAADREKKLVEQDEKLRSRLVDLRLEQISSIGVQGAERDVDRAFAQAFHDYGVDLEGADVVPALKRIRERAIAEEVALALDDWGRVRRKMYGTTSEKAENLRFLAMDLDPDPVRKRMREAVAANDLAAMRELVSPANLSKLGPGSIFVVCAALWNDHEDERKREVHRIVDQARNLYPGDFVLQAAAGFYYQEGGRYESALAARSAALCLRPNDATARLKLGESQYNLGRMSDALATMQRCVAQAPDDPDANYMLGVVQFMLGDFEGSVASLSRSPEITASRNKLSDLAVARYYMGALTHDEFVRPIAFEVDTNALATYLSALVDVPDPKLRDPKLVLRVLEERAASLTQLVWPAVIEAIARVRLEDWSGAYELIGKRYKRPGLMVMTPPCYEFARSLICSKLGRTDEARACYARAMVEWENTTRGDDAAWAKSDAARWRREAEAALAK